MEIIHVVLGKANPARMNGVNKVVNDLASHQAAEGLRVCVWGITASLQHDYPERLYTTRLFKKQKNPFSIGRELLKALDQQHRPVVFHLHGGFIPVFCRLARALHKRRLPFVFTPHGSYNTIALQRSRWTKKIYFRLFEQPLLQKAAAVHCLGKSETEGLHRILPAARTVLIPYGFEAGQRTAQPAGQPFIIGFCGRLDIYTKGLDILLQAFAAFSRDISQAQLWIIGDSQERQQLQQMAMQLNIFDKVSFWGSRFGAEKEALLCQLHLFAHPSRNEGLPASVLEAAAMGIPCVVTEATNMGQAIAQYRAGEVIAQPDAAALDKALRLVYHNIHAQGWAAISTNARHMVTEKFNWKTVLQQFQQLYSTL